MRLAVCIRAAVLASWPHGLGPDVRFPCGHNPRGSPPAVRSSPVRPPAGHLRIEFCVQTVLRLRLACRSIN
jgi:hypothetical protein